jgi:hypothetical protein
VKEEKETGKSEMNADGVQSRGKGEDEKWGKMK